MWNGVFSPSVKKGLEDHFDVVNVSKDEVLGVVTVTIVFHKSPDTQYLFEIDADDFEADKQAIADEIERQLRA